MHIDGKGEWARFAHGVEKRIIGELYRAAMR